ncbi:MULTISPECIES: response regulator [Paenibacillus]|uniref:response regulator n=1 Tax=Paenibacillus TaxID=44249 RepID=UPI0004AEE6DC|nr:response regulator [Paenibacillus sp. IHBB 10380]
MIKALIVDDEPMHIEGLVRHIQWERLGYEPPLTAESGEEALAILQEEGQIDVLITDVAMPGMTGIELLAECQTRQYTSLQTLIVSGYDEFEFVQEAIHLGAKAYVLKPIKTNEVEEKLLGFRSAIEKKRQLDRETVLLREKVTGSLDVLQDRFVNDLIEGRVENEEMLNSWVRLLDLSTEPRQMRLFVFACDRLPDWPHLDARKRVLFSDGLNRTVRVGYSDFDSVLMGRCGADDIAVISLGASPSERARMEKQISFVQEGMREQHGISVSVGISRECIDFREVRLLYNEVKHLLAKSRLAGDEGLVYYVDRFEATAYRESRQREEHIPEIVRLLEKGEGERALIFFNHVFDLLLMQTPVSFSYVQAFGMGLISELARKAKRTKDEDGDLNIQMWQRLIGCTGTAEVRETVLEYLYRFIRDEQHGRIAQQHHLVHNVICYIENHIQDNVTVKQLAELFQINSSYLSVLFKKETGRTITDFVQETRINKAKELLRDPFVKVYEVAEKVGFQTTAYFTFLFKKMTGVTPQEFRDYHYKE